MCENSAWEKVKWYILQRKGYEKYNSDKQSSQKNVFASQKRMGISHKKCPAATT